MTFVVAGIWTLILILQSKLNLFIPKIKKVILQTNTMVSLLAGHENLVCYHDNIP